MFLTLEECIELNKRGFFIEVVNNKKVNILEEEEK